MSSVYEWVNVTIVLWKMIAVMEKRRFFKSSATDQNTTVAHLIDLFIFSTCCHINLYNPL